MENCKVDIMIIIFQCDYFGSGYSEKVVAFQLIVNYSVSQSGGFPLKLFMGYLKSSTEIENPL